MHNLIHVFTGSFLKNCSVEKFKKIIKNCTILSVNFEPRNDIVGEIEFELWLVYIFMASVGN